MFAANDDGMTLPGYEPAVKRWGSAALISTRCCVIRPLTARDASRLACPHGWRDLSPQSAHEVQVRECDAVSVHIPAGVRRQQQLANPAGASGLYDRHD